MRWKCERATKGHALVAFPLERLMIHYIIAYNMQIKFKHR